MAIVEEIIDVQRRGGAVLVGTPSVEASQRLSEALKRRRVEHALLNAVRHEAEAEVVEAAGRSGRVTIATNMAGRGTDIVIDETVRANGGLHVLATELHSSRRIDRQLFGRTARQGDPGTCRAMVSFEDSSPSGIAPRARRSNGELPRNSFRRFVVAQRSLEVARARERAATMEAERRREERCNRLGLDPWLDLDD